MPIACEEAAREVLAEVDGSDWWNVQCGSLSHGMAKRVQLAQALIGDPEVVLLDEPTAGLDPRVAYEVRQLIKSRKGRCTLIVSSHNLQELEEICDGAAILDRGRVVASGSMTELTASSEEIRIKLSPGPAPIPLVRDLPMVKRVEWDEERRELVVYFERGQGVDAEQVIGAVLWVLLQNQARISARLEGPWPRAARDGAHRLRVSSRSSRSSRSAAEAVEPRGPRPRGDRQREMEAGHVGGAVDPNPSAVRRDEAPTDVEAEAEPLLPLRSARTLETTEHAFALLGHDPSSAVRDGDLDVLVAPVDRDVERRPGRAVLHRIREEVLEHLLDAPGIDVHEVRRPPLRHADPMRRVRAGHHVPYERPEVRVVLARARGGALRCATRP